MSYSTLKVLEDFSAWGTSFTKGQVIDPSVCADWPKGTLPKRLQNGFLEHSQEEVTEVKVDGGAEAGDNSEGAKAEGKGEGIGPEHTSQGLRNRAAERLSEIPDGSEEVGDNSEGDKAVGKITGVGLNPDTPPAVDDQPTKYELMSKAELVEFAEETHGEKLSLSLSKAALIARIEELDAEQV